MMAKPTISKHSLSDLYPSDFFRPLLYINLHAHQMIERKLEYVSGIAVATVLVIINFMVTKSFASFDPLLKAALLTTLITSFVTVMLCLLSIFPKKDSIQKFNLLYLGRVVDHQSKKEFENTLKHSLTDSTKMTAELADYLYAFGERYIKTKGKKLKLATKVYIAGLGIGVLLVLLQYVL